MVRAIEIIGQFAGLPRWAHLAFLAVVLLLSAQQGMLGPTAGACLLLTVGAFSLGHACRQLPGLRAIGFETIAVVFVPAYLVHRKVIAPATVEQAGTLVQSTDLITVFVTVLIVGSMVGIDRRALVAGSVKLVLPVVVASLVAVLAGTLAGVATGLAPSATFFYTVVPVLGGGINAGALPLSLGYANTFGISQPEAFSRILPPVMLGNVMAVMAAALLSHYGPSLREGTHRQTNWDHGAFKAVDASARPVDAGAVVSSAFLLFVIYCVARLAAAGLAIPIPLTVVLIAAVLHVFDFLPTRLRVALLSLHRSLVAALTWPVLFAAGMLLAPWPTLIESLTATNIVTTAAVVSAVTATGYLCSRHVGLAPVDCALLTTARAAMGGTGDIAILNAARRMDLMAFAQIVTRTGGAITISLALALAAYLGA
ncbi:2-hydroxycarboxylate transporter family protein [Sinorhizobium sp. BG8]|uniref:2-hydroxycarboxylate transporter family protein n=1 Tax=Sinorhizobium sp. BG8 TaxID=2613773 RepID=UPI00193DA64C|nr:2-hydroxycarboxylate transporter family protein [Sinorhizobium sp. BG8]QRM56141.1 hypothetical protein F3Y30_17570 [Sinorhizobium sp. BG8]